MQVENAQTWIITMEVHYAARCMKDDKNAEQKWKSILNVDVETTQKNRILMKKKNYKKKKKCVCCERDRH